MNTKVANSDSANAIQSDLPVAGIGRLLLNFLVVTLVVFAVSLMVWDMSVAWVAILAAAVCCVAAIAGHYCSIFPRGDVFRLARLYQSMAVRIAIPVAFLFLCKNVFPELFERGMVYFVFLFYLVGLLTEVMVQAQYFKVLKSSAAATGVGSSAGKESQAG